MQMDIKDIGDTVEIYQRYSRKNIKQDPAEFTDMSPLNRDYELKTIA